MATEKKGDLRVWWIPQVPMKSFKWAVSSVSEAKNILNLLAKYDIFQFENRVKPDYANVGGLEVFNGEEWEEWENEEGQNIDEVEAV
jgi:hypothetical protein